MNNPSNCVICNAPYIQTRKRAKYCSNKCKQKAIYRTSNHQLKHRRASIENTLVAILWGARSRSKKKGLFCDLTETQVLDLLVKQKGLCAMTGIKLEASTGLGKPFTISIDKIIPKLGYTLSNVQLVCKMFNECKNIYTIEEVKRMCVAFVKHNNINLDE